MLPSLRIPAVSAVSLLLPMKLVICKYLDLYNQGRVVKNVRGLLVFELN